MEVEAAAAEECEAEYDDVEQEYAVIEYSMWLDESLTDNLGEQDGVGPDAGEFYEAGSL